MDRKAFGKRVSAARKAGGMTGEVLAERCHINVTYLRQIEGGTKIPSLPMFTKLCRELNVSPNYLLPELVAGRDPIRVSHDTVPSGRENSIRIAERPRTKVRGRFCVSGIYQD